jgi:peptidoglycan hydrolase-like protein with peptidoglycan-binding domain
MFKKIVVFSLAVVFLISLNGCATGRRQKDLEIQGLKNQVSVLESQIQSKDDEINNLRDELSKASQERSETVKYSGKKKVIGEVKSRPNVKQIQIALRNAGFDPGIADGRMGRQTRNSIKEFQRAHNLGVDGKVGRRTWDLLKEYLYKKVK